MSRSSLSQIISPTVLLYTFVVITQIGRGVYLPSGDEPPPAFIFLSALGIPWIVGWWLLRDSRSRGIAWSCDVGMFLYIAWPLIMPYYLVKSRGAKGLLVILGFVSAFVAALVMGMALYGLVALSAR